MHLWARDVARLTHAQEQDNWPMSTLFSHPTSQSAWSAENPTSVLEILTSRCVQPNLSVV
eukprot:1204495-Pleurochrysis_carterae.AAC.1